MTIAAAAVENVRLSQNNGLLVGIGPASSLAALPLAALPLAALPLAASPLAASPLVFQHAHLIHAPKLITNFTHVTQPAFDGHAGPLVGGDCRPVEIEDQQFDAMQPKFLKTDPQRLGEHLTPEPLAAVLCKDQ